MEQGFRVVQHYLDSLKTKLALNTLVQILAEIEQLWYLISFPKG